jgi:hypothetical protein
MGKLFNIKWDESIITYAEHEWMEEAIIVWFKLLFQYLPGRMK